MAGQIDLKGLVNRKTDMVYVDIDAIILWLYGASLDSVEVEQYLVDIALILQDKKEKMLEQDKSNLENGN